MPERKPIRGGRWESSPLSVKSLELSKGIMKFCTWLVQNREFVVGDQLKRSGLSVGANIREAQEAESSKDMLHKLSIALKEARETHYFLECISETNLVVDPTYDEIRGLINELISLLITSKQTIHNRINKQPQH